MLVTMIAVISLLAGGEGKARLPAGEERPAPRRGYLDEVAVRLLDAAGRPVADAEVGTKATRTEGRLAWNFGGQNMCLTSDSGGWVRCPAASLFPSKTTGDAKAVIYARQDDRGLTALREIARGDAGTDVVIPMVEACRVTGRIDSSELRNLGHEVIWKEAWIGSSDRGGIEFAACRFSGHPGDDEAVEFLLPPGRYRLRCYGHGRVPGVGTVTHQRSFDVERGQKTIALGEIDIPATALTRLIGKPAPELVGIQAWKNAAPLTLAGLRGKVVLLHFWNYRCDLAYPQMHELIALYEAMRRERLAAEVIVVHDGRFSSFADMEAAFGDDPELVKVRRDLWGGKDLPFPIALDSREPARWMGAETYLRGINWDRYDIRSYPETFLIDANGVLRGTFGVDGRSAIAVLRSFLEDRVQGLLREVRQSGIRMSEGDLRGKPLLICFFDRRHPPSLDCLEHLKRREGALKERGIVVLAVNTRGVDDATFERWIRQRAFSFPIGMIRGNRTTGSRRRYDIEMLPWLILMDGEHRIAAEGFAALDLERVMEAVLPAGKEAAAVAPLEPSEIPVDLEAGVAGKRTIVRARSIRFERRGDEVHATVTVDERRGFRFRWRTVVELLDAAWRPIAERSARADSRGIDEDEPIVGPRRIELPPFPADQAMTGTTRFRLRLVPEGPVMDGLGRDASRPSAWTIEGRVTGPDGRAVEDAVVTIQEDSAGRSGHAELRTSTDEDGRFRHGEVQWPYRLYARWRQPLPAGGHRHQVLFLTKVFTGPRKVDFRFADAPAGSSGFTVDVEDQDGNAVSGFLLSVSQVEDEAPPERGRDEMTYIPWTFYKLSDSPGVRQVALAHLPPGKYRFAVFSPPPYAFEHTVKDVVLEAEKTSKLSFTVKVDAPRFGRVVFPDGSPAVISPPPWPGARTRVGMRPTRKRAAVRAGGVDGEGYFAIHLRDDDIEALRSGESVLDIELPGPDPGRFRTAGTFPFEKLSRDRTRAGAVEVERPRASEAPAPGS